MKKLFLDDERFPVSDGWVIVRSVEDAIDWVQANGFPDFVSFDNDLGEGLREGWEFARWLVDNDLDTGAMPDSFDFYPHTQNPVARDRIEGILRQYLNHRSSKAKDMNDIAELADELRDGSRRGTDTCVQAADMLERMREALDLIANTGMDARQCMLTARNALKSI